MVAGKPESEHFNQKPRRKAEFIKPLNLLRSKAGYGGLDDEILNKAQALLENNSVEFLPMAEIYLSGMMRGIERARNDAGARSRLPALFRALSRQPLRHAHPAERDNRLNSAPSPVPLLRDKSFRYTPSRVGQEERG